MTAPSGGPAAIRWLREVSGMTQRELAATSGVSERTIRGLEHGQVNRPHRSSLYALARAAGLGVAERDAFLRAWTPHRVRSLAELNPQRADLILAEAMVQSEIEECLVASHTRFRIDRHGNRVRGHTRVTIEARRADVGTYCVPVLSSEPGQVPSAELTGSVGCELLRRHEFTASGLVVFEFALERPLRLGELATFDFTLTGGPGGPDLFGDHHPDRSKEGWIRRMVHRVVDLLVIELEFEEPPRYVWETSSDGTGPVTDVRELSPQDGRVQVVQRRARPGTRGFRWAWN